MVKTLRIHLADPYATDNSSDEEAFIVPKQVKRFTQVVHLDAKPSNPKNKKENAKKTEKKITKKREKNKQGSDFVGVRLRPWARWGAEISDLFLKKRVWLGTFDTEEEAHLAYEAKKAEIKEKKIREASVSPSSVLEADPHATDNSSGEEAFIGSKQVKRITQVVHLDAKPSKPKNKKENAKKIGKEIEKEREMKKQRSDYAGIRLWPWGRGGVEIRDPFSKKRVWLGTFDTEEECQLAYEVKKAEIEENKIREASVSPSSVLEGFLSR